MGEDVKSSKSFFIVIAVLLALVVIVSYWGDSTAGQATRSQGPGNQEPRCTVNTKSECAYGLAYSFGSGLNETEATADANKYCEIDRQAVIDKYTKCIATKTSTQSCPPPCNIYITGRVDTTNTPCSVKTPCAKLDNGEVECLSTDGGTRATVACKP